MENPYTTPLERFGFKLGWHIGNTIIYVIKFAVTYISMDWIGFIDWVAS